MSKSGGSSTTFLACERTDRICFTMELEPGYCDVIRERFAALEASAVAG